MSSVFTKIISGQIPAFIIEQNDKYIAILARGQVQDGHTLVIPKQEIDKFTDLTQIEYTELQNFAYHISKRLESAFPNKARIVMNIVGFEVPHVHIHLIPCDNIQEAFSTDAKEYDTAKMQILLEKIKNA
jgi:histidine triad (HIT) family protein